MVIVTIVGLPTVHCLMPSPKAVVWVCKAEEPNIAPQVDTIRSNKASSPGKKDDIETLIFYFFFVRESLESLCSCEIWMKKNEMRGALAIQPRKFLCGKHAYTSFKMQILSCFFFFILYSKQNNSPFSKTRYEFSAGVVTTCICPYSKSLSSTCFLTSSISVSLPWVKAFSTNSQLV